MFEKLQDIETELSRIDDVAILLKEFGCITLFDRLQASINSISSCVADISDEYDKSLEVHYIYTVGYKSAELFAGLDLKIHDNYTNAVAYGETNLLHYGVVDVLDELDGAETEIYQAAFAYDNYCVFNNNVVIRDFKTLEDAINYRDENPEHNYIIGREILGVWDGKNQINNQDAFGKNQIVYCPDHLNVHTTEKCTGSSSLLGLGIFFNEGDNYADIMWQARDKCRRLGLKLIDDNGVDYD